MQLRVSCVGVACIVGGKIPGLYVVRRPERLISLDHVSELFKAERCLFPCMSIHPSALFVDMFPCIDWAGEPHPPHDFCRPICTLNSDWCRFLLPCFISSCANTVGSDDWTLLHRGQMRQCIHVVRMTISHLQKLIALDMASLGRHSVIS